MTYEQAVERFRTVKKGMPSKSVIALLGEPARKQAQQWFWDFTKLEGFPGIHVGTQTFTGGAVTLDDALVVVRSDLAWVDATGPGSRR